MFSCGKWCLFLEASWTNKLQSLAQCELCRLSEIKKNPIVFHLVFLFLILAMFCKCTVEPLKQLCRKTKIWGYSGGSPTPVEGTAPVLPVKPYECHSIGQLNSDHHCSTVSYGFVLLR